MLTLMLRTKLVRVNRELVAKAEVVDSDHPWGLCHDECFFLKSL